jgi:hypothetical protein
MPLAAPGIPKRKTWHQPVGSLSGIKKSQPSRVGFFLCAAWRGSPIAQRAVSDSSHQDIARLRAAHAPGCRATAGILDLPQSSFPSLSLPRPAPAYDESAARRAASRAGSLGLAAR